MRTLLCFLGSVLVLLPGLARAEVRFTEGPAFTRSGQLLIVSGSLAGLEGRKATFRVEAQGTADVVCRNADGKVMRRTKDVPANMHVEQEIEPDMIADGHAALFLMCGPPVLNRKLASCGNPRWTATVEGVTFRTAVIIVTQGGAVVFRQTFKP
jgi:hypothetical protein